jgi:membrane protein YdbS with pleckstrin-like domain
MPNDVKAFLSAVVAVVAIGLAYWNHSPIRHEFGTFVLVTAAFMIVAMWIFPEAVGKAQARKQKRDLSAGS